MMRSDARRVPSGQET